MDWLIEGQCELRGDKVHILETGEVIELQEILGLYCHLIGEDLSFTKVIRSIAANNVSVSEVLLKSSFEDAQCFNLEFNESEKQTIKSLIQGRGLFILKIRKSLAVYKEFGEHPSFMIGKFRGGCLIRFSKEDFAPIKDIGKDLLAELRRRNY